MKIYCVALIALVILSSNSCDRRPSSTSSLPSLTFSPSATPVSTDTLATQIPLPGTITLTLTPKLSVTQTPVPRIPPSRTPLLEEYQPITADNAKSAKIIYELKSSSSDAWILGLEFNPIGGTLVLNEAGDLQIWRYPIQGTKISIHDFQLGVYQDGGDHISAFAFSPDGKTIASIGDSGNLSIRDLVTGKQLSQAATHLNPHAIVYSPDGSTLAVAGYQSSDDKYIIQVWKVSDTQLIATLNDFPTWYNDICSLAWSSNGAVLAAGFCDYHIKAWNVQNEYKPLGRVVGEYAFACYSHCSNPTNSIAFMPKSAILATGTDNPGIPLIDIYTGRLALSMSTARNAMWKDPDSGEISWGVAAPDVIDLVFSPDGTVLAIATWDEIQLRSTKTNEMLAFFETPDGTGFTGIAFSPDGRLVAGSTDNGTIYMIGVKDSYRGR